MRFGWEEDIDTIWLDFFNKKVLEAGLITEAEYHIIGKKIHDMHPLKKERFSGKMNRL